MRIRLLTLKWIPIRERVRLGFLDFLKYVAAGRRTQGNRVAAEETAPASWAGPYDLPDWGRIIAADPLSWACRPKAGGDRPRVLMATAIGGHGPATVIESTLAAALTLRKAEVHVLLCDQRLPGCLRVTTNNLPDPGVLERYELPRKVCGDCQARGTAAFGGLGLTLHWIGDLVSDEESERARALARDTPVADIATFSLGGMALGEHARAGALRYFARGDLEGEPKGEVILRRYLEAACLTAFAMNRLLGTHHFDAACFHHGLYVPQGIIGEACRRHDVRVTNWCVSYRRNTVIFSHGDTYHHTLLDEPTAEWEDMDWSTEHDRSIADYLKSRWHGSRDWVYFHENPKDDFTTYAREAGIDLKRPCIGLLTNVMWDAQLHYRANAFPDMLSWVLATIDYFAKRPELQLIIRVHPAEIRGTVPSRQPLVAEILKSRPDLPANVFIVPPEENISTYGAMEICNAAIIYGTKMGVELSSVGMPVIVAGEAWIRNKGLTRDASSPEDYFRILDRLPFDKKMTPEDLTRARKYAYHFFFRRMIPLPFLEPNKTKAGFDLAIARLSDLGPGRWPGLDVICDGILRGAPFVYPAEKLGLHDGAEKTAGKAAADAR